MSRTDVKRSFPIAGVEVASGGSHHTLSQGRQAAWRSFLRKPRLTQTLVPSRKVVGDVLAIPFDGEARIEAKGFSHERLRLVHLAQERIGGGEVA
jgi:hypothetical protein